MARPRVIIVGGGISGLATAYHLTRNRPDASITVFEEAETAGGTARTDRRDGYTIDRGPTGFLGNAAETLELVDSLGLQEELQPAAGASIRYLYRGGRLRPVPRTPLEFLRSDLLSPMGKLRTLLEPFARRGSDIDETVHDFAVRRLGRPFADAFVTAMVRGTTAGDAKALSMAARFPRIRQLEERHGSLARAMLATQRTARKRPSGPDERSPHLTSFKRDGMQRLIDALAARLGTRLLTGERVVRIGRAQGEARFHLYLASGGHVPADLVVLATPAYATARLLAPLIPDIVPELEAIPYAELRVMGLGYPREAVPQALNGFGFLVPPDGDLRMLGCLWTSSLFPQQAPPGMVLLRVIAGGIPDAGLLELGDVDALLAVREELRECLGITAPPAFVHQLHWRRAIPQYVVGHQARVERIMAAAARHPGLFLTGNAYYGVGFNDCAREARRVAGEVGRALKGQAVVG